MLKSWFTKVSYLYVKADLDLYTKCTPRLVWIPNSNANLTQTMSKQANIMTHFSSFWLPSQHRQKHPDASWEDMCDGCHKELRTFR